MAEVINDVNPSGRGTGYDWVYNPSPVVSALQFRENMAQQAALRRAALAMQQERLEQRARQASAKDYTMEPVSGGYYNDLLAEDFNNLQSYLVDAYKRGESPANVRQQINAHKQQAKYFDAISKEHDAFLKPLQSDPIVNKDYLNQALQESRISLAEPAWKQRKSRTEMYVPDIKQIHQATLSNPKIWNPAAVGSEVVRTLTGSDSYTFQGPDAKGTTVKRDKILDSKGNVNLEVAKDIVASTPRYNQVYTTLFDANMK